MWISVIIYISCSATVLCRKYNGVQYSNNERQIPKFLHEPSPRHEFLNSSGAVLPCSALGSPSPVVRWHHEDGTPALDIPGIRHTRPDGSLVFQPFRQEQFRQDVHATAYRCTAGNVLGTIASRDVHVVAVMPQRYAVEMHDEFVLKGNTAVLRCHVPGFVKDYVRVEAWIKDPTEKVDGSLKTGRYSIFPTGELHVRHVQQTDALSSFSCRTKHRITGLEVSSSNPARIIVTEPYGQVPPRITHTATRVVVPIGDTALLPCVGQAFPVPTYRWYRKDGGLSISPVRIGHRREMVGGTLVLRNTEIRDSGRYVCVLASSGNEDKAETELIVTAKLSVTIFPHERVADMGESVSFNCTIRGFPVSHVRWSRNAKLLQDGGRIRIIGRNQLLLTSVRREDHGLYQCFASNDADSAQGIAQLTIGDNPPEFLHTFLNSTVNPGSPVSLKCSASGNPLPQITWSLDGAQVPEDQSFRSGDYVTLENTVVSYVNISRAGVEHSGEFSCSATNDAGQVTHSGWLRVPGPPFVRPMKNQTIVAGDFMRIRCPAGGYPIHRISWERDGVRLPDNHRQTVYPNGTLLVRHVERTVDEGKYTCTLRNKEGESAKGSLYITVRVRPVIEPFSVPPSVQMGQRLSITCTVVKGDPPITLKWLRDEESLRSHEGDVRIHNLADHTSTLLFDPVRPEHRANYTCVASNEAGSERHSAQMVIHVPPRWKTEPNDIDVIKGRSVMIDCESEGFPPPRLTWRKADGSVPESYKPISSSSHLHVFENGSLTILDVTENDAGYYLCQASNSIGSGLSKVISLTVHVAAHFTTKFHAEIVKKTEDAKLSCQAFGERPLTIQWTKDRQPLSTKLLTRYRQTETVFTNGTLSELLIESVDRSDSALFTCFASNSYGKDETNIQLIIQEKPDIPQEMRVMRKSSRSVEITWSPPYSGNSRLLKYLLQYEETADEKTPSTGPNSSTRRVSISPSETTWSLGTLIPSTRYALRLTAVNALGESEASSPIIVTTEEEAPGGPPLAVKTQPLSSSAIKVLWEPPEASLQFGKIKGYYVGYKTKDSNDKFVYKTLDDKENYREERILTNLARHSKYLIRVQAFNSKGAGPPSDDVEVETLKEDPPRPPTLEIIGVTATSVTLKWKKEDDSATSGYTIHYKKEYGSWKAEEVYGDLTSYTIGNLQCGMRYDFYITLIESGGHQSEVIHGRTTGRAPIAPEKEELLLVNATAAVIQLNTWKSGGCPITHFEIKYKQQRQKNWILFADRVSTNKKSITISSLAPSTWYQLQLTSHNEAGPTEAEYIFTTAAAVKGALNEVLVSGEAVPFYLELEVVLPVSLSLVVVVAVLVLVCLIVKKRNPSETSHTAASQTYVSRKSQAGESVTMCDMEKSNYQRPSSRHGNHDPSIYYPTPYATTHIADGPCRKSLEAAQRELQEEPQYATVKRTPRPPKSDMHIYHYPVHIPPELLDELQATSSQWDDGGHTLMDTAGYIARRSSRT